MHDQDLEQFIDSIPARGRVALALAIATRVAESIADPAARTVTGSAIEAGWRWLDSAAVSASDLYALRGPIVQVEQTLKKAGAAAADVSAVVIVGTAFSILTFRAYTVEKERGLLMFGQIPSDVVDFDDRDLLRVCERASLLMGRDFDTLCTGFMKKIAARVAGHAADELGPLISRQELAL